MAITDNIFQRQLNLIEQSRSFHLLHQVIQDTNSLLKEASTLGLPNNILIMKKIIKLGSLPDEIQQYIISNSISLPIALQLSAMEKNTAVKIANIFNMLGLGLNKQREALKFLKEISIRENKSIPHLFEENHIKSILTDDTIERAHKARKVRSYLKKRRFPQLTGAEDIYRRRVSELKLEPGTKLIPPINFEGTTYTFHIDFKNLEELKTRQGVLDRIINNPVLESILG